MARAFQDSIILFVRPPSTPPSALNVLHLIRYPADVAIKGDSLTSRQDVPGSLQSRMCGKSTYIS